MENRGINLSSLRRSGSTPQPAVRLSTAPKMEEVDDDYVSPLTSPEPSKPVEKPKQAAAPRLPTRPSVRLPRATAPLPPVCQPSGNLPAVPMTVKPKVKAPKKRGRPAGKKNMTKRGDNGIVLTAADYHRLKMLMVHGGMTRDHLAFLASQATSSDPRVDALVKAGYIDAEKHEGRKFLYLSKKGFNALDAHLKGNGLTFYSPRRTRPSTHDLKIITVCAALSLGEETFYGLSNKEVDILNRNKATYNRTAQNDNAVLEAMKQEILSRGPRTQAERDILNRKPRSYKTSAFYKQSPQDFAPSIITGPKPIITENQIREANTAKNKAILSEMTEENPSLTSDQLPRNPVRDRWGKSITSVFEKEYPLRAEGDLSPLTDKEREFINLSLANPKRAWIFDYLDESVASSNPHLRVRGGQGKTHRPDGVIVLPHIQGADGFIRGGCVAIEVEENMKKPAETIANMVALFEHPLYQKAIYYVPDGVGYNNIHNRLNAVEKDLSHGYRGMFDRPLRDMIEDFFVVVRMDEDYFLSYRSSPKGEWG